MRFCDGHDSLVSLRPRGPLLSRRVDEVGHGSKKMENGVKLEQH